MGYDIYPIYPLVETPMYQSSIKATGLFSVMGLTLFGSSVHLYAHLYINVFVLKQKVQMYKYIMYTIQENFALELRAIYSNQPMSIIVSIS